MTVLLDTNIILDVALNRKNFVEKSAQVLLEIQKHNVKAFVSATTITDIYYIANKSVGKEKSLNFIKSLLTLIDVAGIDRFVVLNALQSNLPDFEDAVQTATALRNNIELIITRNKKDFQQADINVFTPEEFINILNH